MKVSDLRFLSIAILSCVLFLSGCTLLSGKKVLSSAPPPPVQQEIPRSPLAEIENAFIRSDYNRVEVLGQRLINSHELSSQEKTRAAQLYAVAAVRSKHPNVALTALDAWRSSSPEADTGRDWQEIWCDAVGQLSSREARTKANEVYQDSSRKPVVRGVAAVFFAVRQWEDADLGQTMQALEAVYKAAPDNATRAAYEGRLSSLLNSASGTAIGLIADSVTEENQSIFPYNIILIDQLHRQKLNAQVRPQAEEALSRLEASVSLADPSLFKGPPVAVQFTGQVAPTYQDRQPTLSQSQPGQSSVALVLPRSGHFGSISSKIIKGAEIGAKEKNLNLIIIDSDQPGWMDQINALPQDALAVGGPLRSNDYSSLKAGGHMANRAFFAFLASLEQGDEGRIAWRFFSSPQDQVRTLVNYTSSIGVKKYASLYPQEQFGQRMSQLFEAEVLKTGGTVKSATYTPNQSDSWLRAAGELLAGEEGSGYQAIFLPETLRNSDKVIPSIEYYDKGKHLILGTSLWEQGLSGGELTLPQHYSLAIFPGSWSTAAPSAAAQRLNTALHGENADFWTGLGYDFVRMAPQISLQPGWNSNYLNASLSSMNMDWSIAPLIWNGAGMARQELFLFTPREGYGYVPIDREAFRNVIK